MDLSFLQNPIVLAIIAGALSYLYLYLEHKKKQEENPKATIEPINYTIPGVIALVTLALAYGFFGFRSSSLAPDQIPGLAPGPTPLGVEVPKLNQGGFTEGTQGAADSFGSNTFHLVGKNTIKLPQTDVFIDLAHF
jgi:hypothetical protein